MSDQHIRGAEVAGCTKPVCIGCVDVRRPNRWALRKRGTYGILSTPTGKVWHFRTAMMIWFVAVVLVSATLTVQAERYRDHAVAVGALPRPAASPTQTSTPASTACLESLATAVAATTPDPPDNARYTYHHLRWWTADDTIRPGQRSRTRLLRFDERRWRADDGSGRIQTITSPGVASVPASTQDLVAGELQSVLPASLPSDPTELVAALRTALAAVHPPRMGPQWAPRAVADVFTTHLPHRDVRIGLLRLLATAEAVRCDATATDRAGRNGIAVSVDSNAGAVRDTLIFHPVTGDLLAHEEQVLRNPKAMTAATPRVRRYVLHLAHEHRTTLDT